ncbi:glycosyltransferase family 4 protein [Pseudomonas citronellolis]|uniref:glycosyltransferase family 4 protein n=1 Tax=Pseudomonas citronellolis TaxID=53408 RepID=UPI000A907B2B|nr:glycosyltransferase family 4 protein [Pseudomonas humi]
MPRILIITRNLPPLIGGMERLNWHLIDELSQSDEVQVIAATEAVELAPERARILGVALHPTWYFLLHATLQALRTARLTRPAVIIAGSGLTAPIAWLAALVSGAKAAVYLHGLDVTTRHPVYRALWLPAIRRIPHVITNSRSTTAFAVAAGVSEKRISLIHPGVKTPAPEFPQTRLLQFRDKHDLGDNSLLISVGRLTSRKGILEFVQQGLPPIVRQRPNTLLLVVGDAPNDALHAHAQSRENILIAARKHGVENHLRFLGPITDQEELCVAYQAAGVHVFPVRQIPGDSEGFGMVAIEAAANGLPTVAFATGGIVDAVEDGISGFLVPPHDYQRLAHDVIRALDARTEMQAGCRLHSQRFSWERFGTAIRDALLPSAGNATGAAQRLPEQRTP